MSFLFPEAFLAPTCYWIMHKHLSLDPETLIDLFLAYFPYLVSYYLSQQVAFANFLLTQTTPSHWPASFLLITHLPYLLFAFPNSIETFTLLFCFPITFYLFWDNCINLALILTLPSLIPTSYIQSKFPVMTKYLWIYPLITTLMGFPGGTDSKESAWNAGELGLIPGSGRSTGEGNGNPLQYSCLENSMDREAWWDTVHGVPKD